MSHLEAIVHPNAEVDRKVKFSLVGGWIAFFALSWVVLTIGPQAHDQLVTQLPKPQQVGAQLAALWTNGGIAQLFTSTTLSVEAVALASILSLGLSYLSTIPLFRAPVDWIGKLRFLSLTGILVVFMLMTHSERALKLSVLVFSVSTFLINDLLQVIDDISPEKFDYARTLGLNRWQVLWQVVVRGTLAPAFESIRMNAAMAWMMLTLVEGIARSEGGIGVLLLSLQRSGNYAAIFAIQLLILLVGMGQDRLIKLIKALVCPYTVRS